MLFDPDLPKERFEDTEIRFREIVAGCEPPALLLEATLITENEMEMAIDFARFINGSVGRALVMQGIVEQRTLDLAIEVSQLVRGKRMERDKALELLRVEREVEKMAVTRDSVLRYACVISEMPEPDCPQEEEVDLLDLVFNAEPELCKPVDFAAPSLNPFLAALHGVFAKNTVFYSR